MAIPEIIRYRVQKELNRFCKERMPLHLRENYRLSFAIRGNNVTLFEEEPDFVIPEVWTKFPIAQFRYGEDNIWTLYSRDRNERWNEYEKIESSNDVCSLLEEVDSDPTGIFWG